MSIIHNINNGGQWKFVKSKAPSVAAIAGFGSGKTHAVWLKMFNWMNDHPKVSHGYFAPTYSLIRDIFVPEVQEFCAENGLRSKFKKQESLLYVQGYAPIYCRSMDNPDTIVGFEIGNAAVDEIDLLPADKAWLAWRKIKARCRKRLYEPGKKKKRKNEMENQMALASTPEGFKFAYEAFKKKPIPGSELYQMSTYDNAHNLPKSYIQELLNNYPAELISAYIMGLFTNLKSGRVWTSYDRDLNRTDHVVIGNEPLVLGQDFNVTRGCVVIYVWRRCQTIREELEMDKKVNTGFYAKLGKAPPPFRLAAVGEIVDTLDTPASIRIIKEKYPKNPINVIPDATGQNRKSVNATISDLSLLKTAGFRVIKNEVNPNVKDRVTASNAYMCNALGERNLMINDSLCPSFAEGLETQIYDKNGQPEKGAGKGDDITDAGTYPIAKLFPIKTRSTQLKRITGI